MTTDKDYLKLGSMHQVHNSVFDRKFMYLYYYRPNLVTNVAIRLLERSGHTDLDVPASSPPS